GPGGAEDDRVVRDPAWRTRTRCATPLLTATVKGVAPNSRGKARCRSEVGVWRMTGREGDGLSRGSSSGDLTRSLIVAVLVGVGAVLALILAYQALSVLKVIAVALLLAVVLRTAVMGLERLGVPPLASAFILLAGVAAFGALMYFVLLPSIAHQVRSLISEGPGSLRSVSNMVQGLPFAPNLSEIIQQARS